MLHSAVPFWWFAGHDCLTRFKIFSFVTLLLSCYFICLKSFALTLLQRQADSQWERPCMFLPALNLLPFGSGILPGLTKDTPASNSVNLSCDVSFCFASPDTIFIFAEYHVAHLSCRVGLLRNQMKNRAGTNITPDCRQWRIGDRKSAFSLTTQAPIRTRIFLRYCCAAN